MKLSKRQKIITPQAIQALETFGNILIMQTDFVFCCLYTFISFFLRETKTLIHNVENLSLLCFLLLYGVLRAGALLADLHL